MISPVTEFIMDLYHGSTTYSVQGLEMDKRYYFAVTAIDYSGNESEYSREVNGIVKKEDSPDNPQENDIVFSGSTYNFPNPFSAGNTTSIKYELAREANVTIRIFDLNNELIATIVDNEFRIPGEHIEDKWDGMNTFGTPVSAGVYLCQIDTGSQIRIVKIAVIP